jgi:hypothetical protein
VDDDKRADRTPRHKGTLSKRGAIILGIALLALAVLGFLLPSVRAGTFAVNGSAITSVVGAAIIAATLLGSDPRKH